ncbi:hypothetical protein LKE08_16965, partial [Lyngbya sp. CCY1209]|nr:hypothetical protein [Lyngbya sp. CCY1209]
MDESPAGEPTPATAETAIAAEVVADDEGPNIQCTLKKTTVDRPDNHHIILVSGACDGIEEPVGHAPDYREARRIADGVKLAFGQRVMIRHWTGDDSEIWRRHEDEIDPDTLPELKQTDDRFEPWTPWMKAGAKFTTPRGTRFTIVGFD